MNFSLLNWQYMKNLMKIYPNLINTISKTQNTKINKIWHVFFAFQIGFKIMAPYPCFAKLWESLLGEIQFQWHVSKANFIYV